MIAIYRYIHRFLMEQTLPEEIIETIDYQPGSLTTTYSFAYPKEQLERFEQEFFLLFGKIIRECGSDIDLGKPTKQLACPSHKCSLRRSRGK